MCTPACVKPKQPPKPASTGPDTTTPRVRFGGLLWIGVPLPIRIYAFRHKNGRRPSSMPGCGCTVAGKRLVHWLAARLGPTRGARLSHATTVAAVKSAAIAAAALHAYLRLLPPTERLASLLQGCGAVRRKTIKINGPCPRPEYRNGRSVVLLAFERARTDGIDIATAVQRVLQALSDESVEKDRLRAAAIAAARG